MEILGPDNDSSEDDEVPSELENLLTKYQDCDDDDAVGKLVILSLINKSSYTHDYICNLLSRCCCFGKLFY